MAGKLFDDETPQGDCFIHGCSCPCYDANISDFHPEAVAAWSQTGTGCDPVVGMSAGTSCQNFAMYGPRSGTEGENMYDFLCYMAEVLYKKPHWLLTEITSSGTEALLSKYLQDE